MYFFGRSFVIKNRTKSNEKKNDSIFSKIKLMTKEKLKKAVTITKKPGNNTCSKNELRKVERNKKYKNRLRMLIVK